MMIWYKRLIARFSLMTFLTGTFLITLFLLTLVAWNVWDTYRSQVLSFSQSSHLQELNSLLSDRADDQLMAVRLVVASGDSLWEQPYHALTPRFDAAFNELATLALTPNMRATMNQLATVHTNLATMDDQIFRWVRSGRPDRASQLLASQAYTTQQQTYSESTEQVGAELAAQATSILERQHQAALTSVGMIGLTLVLLLGLWATALREVHSYLAERKRVAAARKAESAYLLLLQTVTTAANEATTLEDAARTCLDQVCALTGWPVGHLYLVSDDDPDELLPATIWHSADHTRFAPFQAVTLTTDIRRGISLPGRVLATGQPEWVTRLTTPIMTPRMQVALGLGIQASFAFPILVGTRTRGVLEFFSLSATPPDAALLEVMSHLGIQLGRVAERAQAAQALACETRLVQLLQMVTAAANEAISVPEALQVALEQVCVRYGWPLGHAYAEDPNGSGELVSTGLFYCDDPEGFAPFIQATRTSRVTSGVGMAGGILSMAQPGWVSDVTQESAFTRLEQARACRIKGWFAFPVVITGKVVAVLEFFATDARPQDAALVEAAGAIGTQLGRVAERTRAEAALLNSDAKTRALVEAIPDAILRIGIDAVVLDYKAASSGDLPEWTNAGAGTTIYDLLPRVLAQQAMHYMWRALQTGVAQSFECQVGEDRLRDCEVRVVAGGEEEALIILRDITERKNMDRMKNEFISTVSHELRTPLTSIRGSLGLIAGGVTGPIPPQARALVDIALNNSERLVRLINDILDIEKIESGRMNFEMKPQPLLPLVTEAIEANRAYAAQFGVTLALDPAPPDVLVEVDSDRLTQVLTNLISNAAKFSPLDGTVTIGVARSGDAVRVSLTDHGRGIPEEFQQRIFQKFAQADSSDTRQKGGTGLGLSITRAIVERLGGSIGFETEANVGTTFYFDLPEWKSPAAAVAFDPPSEQSATRILICEDDRDIATLLRMLLAQEGYASDIAYDAAQAQALLAQNHYAAMTLDVLLPDQNGVNLINDLRAQAHTRNLPIVIVSATPELGKRELSGTAITISDWLAKPIDQARLSAAVRRATRAGGTGRPRILHVEDDPDVRQVIAVLLQDMGDLTAAPDLRTARRLLAQQPFDLILLDVGLPDGSGLDLLPHTGGGIAPHIPVVLFSAQEIEAETARGVVATLLKSRTSNDEFLAIVTSLIRGPDPVIGEQRAA